MSCCGQICKIFLIKYLTPILMFIGIPILGVLKIIFVICRATQGLVSQLECSLECHERKTASVQDQVLEWNQNGRKNKMCTGRPGWQSISLRNPIYKDTMTRININMGDIINIDTDEKSLRVEPMMTMGKLSSYLLKKGWILPVLPELNELTVGGLICGFGVETSSHKYGLFQNICLNFEIVLPNGELVNCSKTENTDLFHAIPWSHGTLGFLTSVTLMIIPAKKFMKLEYIPVNTLDEAVSVFKAEAVRESGNDYVEGLMFSLDKGVIMVGNMVDEFDPRKVNSISRWYKPWFYKHVETFLQDPSSGTGTHIEYIPLRDYLHRHDKGCFWELEYAFPFANNIFYRYLFGWILPLPLQFFLLLPSSCKDMMNNLHVLQDFLLPLDHLKKSLVFIDEVTHVFPIWLCPVKTTRNPGLFRSKSAGENQMYVDIGVYGMTSLKSYEVEKTGKQLESFCLENGGYEALYTEVFLSREQFESMFDHNLYFKMRKQYHCEDAFPEVYDKICRAARR